ncbi:MAG: glutamine--tRNA ligase/YqeY domain fusion protein [Gemmatimonadetes bacterium]|nr:glutamine--tRNA ligase/YqeY domain fusion protein [Gemmatimonadota bacterium]
MASESPTQTAATSPGLDIIRAVIADDLRNGRVSRVVTRFPPEPNGYLHIGHATSVALNFDVAAETGGVCHLRFDDTNPETEDAHYVEAIKDVIQWLGYDWGEHLYFASDYFEAMYEFAEHLIREGKAYVDSSTEEEIRDLRGTVTEAGRPSRYRDRSVEENLDMFRRMRAGEFRDGAHVLRARIDLASRNMLLRDPILYRIRHAHHYRTADEWCIYPLYDYAHPIEDALECVTHSVCTLEFENNRPLYDWVVENIPAQCRPHQYEFARRNLDFTVMSKRKLLELVRGGYVSGWDDPRMPTIAAFRRRGVTPAAIRSFAAMVGVARTEIRVDIGKMEFAIRDDLNQTSPRVLCVLRPLKVVITNYPEGDVEEIDAPLYPHDVPKEGSRILPFSREILIERDDFMETPSPGYYRLSPGREVRLRYAYIIRCDEVVKDESGEVVELRCSYDPETRGGRSRGGKPVKGTVHWVSAQHSVPCEVRLYDRLFTVPDPEAQEGDFKNYLNAESLVVVEGARIEPSVRLDEPGSRYQFERLGFFCSDMVDSGADHLVYNRTVTLRDTWAKISHTEAPAPTGAVSQPKQRRSPPAHKPPATPAEERTPELEERRERYVRELGLTTEEADVLSRDRGTSDLFEAASATGAAPVRSLVNWVMQELPRVVGERSLSDLPITGETLAALVALVESGTISGTIGRQVLAQMAETGDGPSSIVERRGLQQISDRRALEPLVTQVLAANPAKVDEYRGGKVGLRGFFVGQVMRETSGRANPEMVGALIDERLR